MKRQSQLSFNFALILLLVSVIVPALVEYYGRSSFSQVFWSIIYYGLHTSCITKGSLTIIDNSTLLSRPVIYQFGNMDGASPLPKATIFIKSPMVFETVLLKGDIGMGESYVDGQWNSDNLEAYLRILMINWNNFQYYLSIIDWFSLPMWLEYKRLYSYLHTPEQDQESIEFHYDTGTRLFELFLDPDTMVYTSAMFNKEMFDKLNINTKNDKYIIDKISDLNTQKLLTLAQETKVLNTIKKSDLLNDKNKNNENNEKLKILDIGCGFGYLANTVSKTLAENGINNDVYGITLSKDQLAYAKSKYQSTNDQDDGTTGSTSSSSSSSNSSVNFVLSDYREFMGRNSSNLFDGIFSIEMVEAIGSDQLTIYFETAARLLKENHNFVIQFIGYNSFSFPNQFKPKSNGKHSHIPTFVTKYIFPSGFIPHPDQIQQAASKAGLELVHSESFGKHYALTLRLWRKRLYYNKNEIITIYGENTFYTFDYYLAWCEALYKTDIINNWHFVLKKREMSNGKKYDLGNANDILNDLYNF